MHIMEVKDNAIKWLFTVPKHKKICHGDFNPSNVIVKEDGTITDFNDTFLKTFKLSGADVRNAKFIEFIFSNK